MTPVPPRKTAESHRLLPPGRAIGGVAAAGPAEHSLPGRVSCRGTGVVAGDSAGTVTHVCVQGRQAVLRPARLRAGLPGCPEAGACGDCARLCFRRWGVGVLNPNPCSLLLSASSSLMEGKGPRLWFSRCRACHSPGPTESWTCTHAESGFAAGPTSWGAARQGTQPAPVLATALCQLEQHQGGGEVGLA